MKTAESVVDPRALTIAGRYGQNINGQAFQQNALMSFRGHQYVTWYNADRRVCLGRRKLPAGDWEVIRFTDYHYGNHDAHNTISMGICPADGTIHLSFDHHVDWLKYRVSSKGAATQPEKTEWAAALFGPIRSEFHEGQPLKVTYPRFIVTPEQTLQFYYRGRHVTRVIHTYDAATGTWSGPRPLIGENGYVNNHLHYGRDGRLHLMWHWRGTGQLCYLWTADQGATWKNNHGTTVLATNDPRCATQGSLDEFAVIHAKRATHIMLGGQSIDSKGRPHEIVWHIPDDVEPPSYEHGWQVWGRDVARYHHYWRDERGGWHRNLLPGPVGNRAKIFLDAKDNAYAIYLLNQTDIWDGQIYFTHGDLIITSASAASQWTDWRVIHRQPGPFLNEALFDNARWETEGVLSVFVQDAPKKPHAATQLRILDFQVQRP